MAYRYDEPELQILFRFDDGENVVEPLVLYNSRTLYSLILVEDAIGKYVSLPTNLHGLIRKVVHIYILVCKSYRNLVLVEDDLFALVVERELLSDIAQSAMTKDVIKA